MYAQAPTSDDFWNPANWAALAREVGFTGVLALVLIAFFCAVLWLGLTKWDRHLHRQERLAESQLTLCRGVHGAGGVGNVADFRAAGHIIADVLQDLGDGIGDETAFAIKPKLGRVHEVLRNAPAPLPVLDLHERNGEV